jgi:phosphatidylinositol phospholipase C beta
MRAQQARTSVETAKDVQKDTSLKSKAEKERRLREKHSNNTKIFIDERKTAAFRQDKRREKQKKIHEAQMNDLSKYVQNVIFF